jgi:hypothetical protein
MNFNPFKKMEQKTSPEVNEVRSEEIAEIAGSFLAIEDLKTKAGSALSKVTLAVTIFILSMSAAEAGTQAGVTPEEFVQKTTKIEYGEGKNDTTFITMKGEDFVSQRHVFEAGGEQHERIHENTEQGTLTTEKIEDADGNVVFKKSMAFNYTKVNGIDCTVAESHRADYKNNHFTHREKTSGRIPKTDMNFEIEKNDVGDKVDYMNDNLWAGGVSVKVYEGTGSKEWSTGDPGESILTIYEDGEKTIESIKVDGNGIVTERTITTPGGDKINIEYVFTGDGTVQKNTLDKTFRVTSEETISEDAPELHGLAEEMPEVVKDLSNN